MASDGEHDISYGNTHILLCSTSILAQLGLKTRKEASSAMVQAPVRWDETHQRYVSSLNHTRSLTGPAHPWSSCWWCCGVTLAQAPGHRLFRNGRTGERQLGPSWYLSFFFLTVSVKEMVTGCAWRMMHSGGTDELAKHGPPRRAGAVGKPVPW